MNSMSVSDSTPSEHVSLAQYRQLEARYERLMEVSRQLNSTLDLGSLLNLITFAACELTDTEEASILLIDPSTGELRFEAASNMTGGMMAAIPVPMEGSLGGWVATHGEPLLVEDTRADTRWFSNVDKTLQFETRNLLAVPMRIHSQVIGVVEAVNKREDKPWTSDDVSILSALADQAAIAVQNVHLFQQSDFIAEMVHELRTPLAALQASTALLLRKNLPDDMRTEIVETMQQETNRLTTLTTDFLDLARLESGRTRMETKRFDMAKLLEECVHLVVPRADERGIQIRLDAEPLMAEADRTKIKQVVLNLLTNAIKYNREGGGIDCRLRQIAEESAAHTCCLRVEVQDTGYGISAEDQKHVFEKFYRVAATAEETTGTGLGLSIAARIIEAHGCRIGVKSELGVGTTFFFTLRMAPGG